MIKVIQKTGRVLLVAMVLMISVAGGIVSPVSPAIPAKAASNWGYDTIGAYTIAMAPNRPFGNEWASPGDATIYSVNFYAFKDKATRFKAMIVDGTTNMTIPNGIGSAGVITANSPGWYTSTFSTPPAVSAGKTYLLMVITELTTYHYYDIDASYPRWYDDTNSYYYPVDPLGDLTGDWVNRKYSIYATYEQTGDPAVATGNATDITNTSVTGQGNIISLGGGNMVERGFLYGTSSLTDNVSETGSFGTGVYTLPITGLTSNTTYTYQAFARNNSLTVYGESVNFTTGSAVPNIPMVTIAGLSDITRTSVQVTGNIVDTGGVYASSVIARISDTSILDGQPEFENMSENTTVNGMYGPGLFSVNIQGLLPGVEYFVRVGARNTAGTGWSGGELSFSTTDNITAPAVTVDTVADAGTTTANITANVNSSTVTRVIGVPVAGTRPGYLMYYGSTTNRTYAQPYDIHTAGANETIVGYGFQTISYTGASAGFAMYNYAGSNVTTLYTAPVRAIVPGGQSGRFWVFTNPVNQPLVEGNKYVVAISDFGTTTRVYKGTYNDKYPNVWVGEGVWVDNLSGENFNHIDWNCHTAVALYNSTIDVTQRRIDWGTSPGVYTGNITAFGTWGLGPFTMQLSGLPAGTAIYARAAVLNGGGWGYSAETSFDTQPSGGCSDPTVTTGNATSVTSSTARLNAEISGLDCANATSIFWRWGEQSGNYTGEYVDTGNYPNGAYYHDVSGLTSNTTYYFTVSAKITGGVYQPGSESSYTTLPASGGCSDPTVVTGNATLITSSTARLNTTISELDCANATAILWQWGLQPGNYTGTYTDSGDYPNGAYYHELSGLSPDTTYYYTVSARTTEGSYQPGSEISFTTSEEEPGEETNVALGKTGITTSGSTYAWPVTVLTDGLTSGLYVGLNKGPQWIGLDLEALYDISRVNVRHYHLDGRTYHDVIIQLSADGINWITIFNNDSDNSAGQGVGTDSEYAEEADGRDIILGGPIQAGYVRCWSNGSTANAWNQYIELEVYGEEATGGVNQPPLVDAGSNDTIYFSDEVFLNGTVTDDGLLGGTLTFAWSKESGPGVVTFGNAAAVDTTATFSETGEYILRLTVDDGELTGYDEVTITVAEEPGEETNIALGKTGITASSSTYAWPVTVLTDGVTSGTYVGLNRGPQWIALDLEALYNVSRVNIRHYHFDGRTYHDVIIKLSADGINWITIFNNDSDNSAGQGVGTDSEYAEEAGGRDIILGGPVQARYVRCWSNGSTANAWNQYIELEVYGD